MRTGRGTVMLEQDKQWRLAGICDLDADEREDVLLRHDDGRWFRYLMDGRTVRSSGSVPLRRTPPGPWQGWATSMATTETTCFFATKTDAGAWR